MENIIQLKSIASIPVSQEELQPETERKSKRDQWGRQLEFILTCVGFAVGLGNVWRFPYLCYKNGGGAFLIPYVISMVFLGVPVFFLEVAFGQFAGRGPFSIWNISPIFKGLGYAMVIIGGLVSLYYNVIVGYCIYYFFASMKSEVPWKTCDHDWNTCQCSGKDNINNYTSVLNRTQPPTFNELDSLFNSTKPECRPNLTEFFNWTQTSWEDNSFWIQDKIDHYFNTSYMKTPSEEYFNNNVLKLSSGLDEPVKLKWDLTLCLLLAWLIVFAVLIKGIQSLGKVIYFSAIFPYILLTVLLVRGLTLEGSATGIYFYLNPDISRLLDSQVWSDAAVQIFYSLSTCQGGLIALSSYNKFNNNCLRDAILVPTINCLTSFYAGFAIFSVLGFMAHKKGVSVEKVAEDGPGLAFVVYPESIAKMPVAPLWAILFFMMMFILGFSSMFSLVETVFTSLADEYPQLFKERWKSISFRLVASVLFFLLGLPMVTHGGFYLLNIVDNFVGGFPLLITGFLEILVLNYVYGYSKFADDIKMMLGNKPNFFFMLCWCFITPALLLAVIIFKAVQFTAPKLGSYVYPNWGYAIGWLITLFPIIFIPGYILYYLLTHGGWALMKKAAAPLPTWGPSPNASHPELTKHSANVPETKVTGNDSPVFTIEHP